MSKEFLLVAEIDGENSGTMFQVTHEYETTDAALFTIRDALKIWGTTDMGKLANERACHDFNWGDLTLYLDEYNRVDIPIIGVSLEYVDGGHIAVVDHDELLLE